MALLCSTHHQLSMTPPLALAGFPRKNRLLPLCTVASQRDGRRLISAQVNALFNPQDDPIVKEALKEPLAFLGGIFAGVLRLDLTEDPLREWIAKTSEAAGVDINDAVVTEEEETPEEIQIE